MLNKKGSKYLTPWLVFMWVIIFGGLVIGVYLFYSVAVEVKADEAEILAFRLSYCLTEDGFLNEPAINNIFEKCGLNKKIIESGEIFYFDVEIQDLDSKEPIKKIEKGVVDFGNQCKYRNKEDHLAKCAYLNVSAVNSSNPSQAFLIQITTASNQRGNAL